jgi:hypothetical protein
VSLTPPPTPGSPAPDSRGFPVVRQVWNKTVRPAPKVGLQGAWKAVDELHAVLVHCDTWTPRFQGLRGNIVPLGPVMAGQDHRAARHFQDGVITYNELLILEKPPEMSKKKRKKNEDGEEIPSATASPHYRMMFSLYRRDSTGPPPAPVQNADGTFSEPAPDGKHLTFCMAPEDILIRNSFHMLTESEKEARRAEYKSKQLTPKVRPSGSSGGGQSAAHAAAAAATALALSSSGLPAGSAIDVEAEYPSPSQAYATATGVAAMSACSGGLMASVQGGATLPPLTVEALKSQAGGSDHERIVKLEGISPGMCGGAMALLPDAPLLSALSVASGGLAGGTTVWIQGSRFNTRTRVYVAGVVAPRLQIVSDGLVTIQAPPSAAEGTVEVRATNDNCAWSNALHYTYTQTGEAAGSSEAAAIEHRHVTLLQSLVNACCAKGNPASEKLVTDLMSAELAPSARLTGGSLLLLVSGSQGSAALDLSQQDAHGCTLMHYVCGARNLPALQLLLNAGADATIADGSGATPMEWARRAGFLEGQQALSTASGVPMPAAAPPGGVAAAAVPTAVVAPVEPTAAVAATTAGTPPLVSGAVRSLGQSIDSAAPAAPPAPQPSAPAQPGGDGLAFFAATAASVDTAQPPQ